MDVRANAIAKLKRAASQPRNREARRPAGDGQQPEDGDAPGAGAGDPARALSPPPAPAAAAELSPVEPEPVEREPEPQPEPEATAIVMPDDAVVEAEMDPESDAAAATATPAKKRTRSRSRSRSKQRPKDASSAGNQSGSSRPPSRQLLSGPTTPPLPPVSPVLSPAPGQHRRNISSVDIEDLSAPEPFEASTDAPSSLPAFDHPPPLANILTSPPVARALSPFAFNPANAPNPVMSAGPSLSAIQSYLQRSNSAAARQNALYKLNGGRMDLDDVPSQSPPLAAPNVALNRSNTFAGGIGERSALKQAMMQRLAARQPTGPDAETSGEEIVVPMSPSPRRRRRSHRPKRDPSIVDDREPGPAMTPGPSAPATPVPGGPTALSRLGSNQSLNDYRGPSPAVSTTHLLERDRDSALARLVGEDHFEFDKIARAASRSRNRSRGPVIEDEYGEDYMRNYGPSPSARLAQSSQADRSDPSPRHLTVALSRIPNSSDEPTFTTFDSLADRHPVYLPDPSLPSPYRQDVFPQSPFGTPMKELNASDVEFDAAQDLPNDSNGAGLVVPWTGTTRQNIPSWQTFPEPTYHRESEDEDELASPIDPNPDDNQLGIDDAVDYGRVVNSTSYRDDLVIDVGESPVIVSDQDIQGSSRYHTPAGERPQELTPPLPETRPDSVSADWEDLDPTNERSPQHPPAAARISPTRPPSAWDKLKSMATSPTASRSASRIATRSAHVSQLSTNSTASSSSGRAAADASPHQYVSLTQNSSAADSTTMLAIPLPLPSPASFTSPSSPMPPASPADRAKYADSKLQPFPALAAMARKRGMSISHSTPDVTMLTTASGRQTPVSPMAAYFDDSDRPGLVHQASDSKLLARYQQPPSPGPLSAFGPHSGRQGLQDLSHMEYIDLPISPQQKSAPGTKSGRFKWVQKMRGNSQSTIPAEEFRKQRKPSFADLLSFKKAETNGHSRQISNPILVSDPVHAANTFQSGAYQHSQEPSPIDAPGSRHPPRDMLNGRVPLSRFGSDETTPSSSDAMPRTSQSDALLDSSVDDSMHSTHRLTTEFASPHSERSNSGFGFNSKHNISMLRFENLLSSGPLKMMESPPRKLLYMSAVSQVVNVNSVKSRVLFLFNDILVLAQPAAEDESPSAAGARQLLDRKYEVRNVIELYRMRYCSGRDEPSELDPGKGIVPRQSDVQLFIREFTTDPEQAVGWICGRAGIDDNSVALGRFLFETVELERVALGRYLADRVNRTLLKAFIDCFGFAGVRVDTALRIFLLGLGLPPDDAPATEMLLGVFAGRWFDLNSGLVSYDKELTARLVRSIVSLNDALHPDAEDMYYGHYQPPPSPQISARHFIEACRQYDPSALIGDDVLAGIYRSILMERLRYPGASIYRHSRGSGPPSQIKAEGLPTRLTYRVPSEPIRVRISYPDPHFIVHLQGKDLLFDPPVLQFDRSREATFRVTGTSLGVKSIIMYCAGSRASEYSGLPLSTNVNIERAYMKPVFQIAFPSQHGIRRYMFSVDDANILQDWMQLLQLHVSTAAAAQQNRSPNDADALYRAAEVVAVEAMRACIGSTYRGHELVILAQQNSVIPSVLSMLRGA